MAKGVSLLGYSNSSSTLNLWLAYPLFLCALVRFWYSCKNPTAPTKMALGWGWTLSMYTLFRAFQIPQDTTAHFSNSAVESLCTKVLNSRKKSLASFGHFWIFPGHKAHTFLAKGHSHSKWPADSGCWQLGVANFIHIHEPTHYPPYLVKS